ncbi:hypothetical protein [Bartonella sp. CB169]|uniref:hypothetical protein n=1 Tax=Bartonella sp. CB169 TaxID=3112257 RepID=UPI00300E2EFD
MSILKKTFSFSTGAILSGISAIFEFEVYSCEISKKQILKGQWITYPAIFRKCKGDKK